MDAVGVAFDIWRRDIGEEGGVERERGGERERGRENWKTLILKDSGVRSIWTSLTQPVLAILQRERENWKTLILKDNSVRSIWTCLTASPCERAREREREREREDGR